jgi:glutamyl-tRNA reductase
VTSELLALGTSHKTAPLAVRERLALLEGQVEPFLHELVEHPAISEAVAVSTCNRTELYVVAADPVEGESAVLALLARRAGTPPTALMESIYADRNCDAARHLFRVVSGLESMIVGEAEIQGQVKRAYDRALAARTTGPLTNKLFRAALATGKRVRTETAISLGHASVATVAVDAARAVVGEPHHVVVVGAGDTSEQVARAFFEQGVSTMFVANRRRDRAIALAERFGGASGSFDALPDELSRADVVVSSTASPHAIIGAEELAAVMAERAGRPLLLVDLAVPRDIDPACGELGGVTLMDMDALQSSVRRHLRVRRAEAARAAVIVEEEIQAFAGWLGTLDVLPTLTALRARGDAVVDGLLAENAGRWEDLSERDLARVEALARAVVKRLLHEPTQRVKALDGDHRHARLQLLRELFGLEDAAGGESAESAEVRALRRP